MTVHGCWVVGVSGAWVGALEMRGQVLCGGCSACGEFVEDQFRQAFYLWADGFG